MEIKPQILIVDDERNTREGLARAFGDKYDIMLAENADVGMDVLKSNNVDMILTDLRMPGMDGMTFIRQVNHLPNPPLIILFTAYGNLQTAVAAMKEGAYDYLTKPLNLDNVEMVIDRGLATRAVPGGRLDLKQLQEKIKIIGESPAINSVLEVVQLVAPARSTVLLTGESGTGKEVVAQAIHQISPRSNQPFVVVHCASLNPNLLETELFGHEKGAYTGAHDRQTGRFEMADGGVIFLDEIGEIDATTQIKLLRILENRTFERVGGGKPITVDVRVIAATNRNLKELVKAGTFREDLYFRLNVVNIHLPPLRERKDDILLLLDHFLRLSCQENGKKINGFSKEALNLLTAYAWPGNVRELRNSVERMVVMALGSTLTVKDVPPDIQSALADSFKDDGQQAADKIKGGGDLNIDHQEKRLIAKALAECGGNKTRAAEMLGVSRRTLHRKLNAYGLD